MKQPQAEALAAFMRDRHSAEMGYVRAERLAKGSREWVVRATVTTSDIVSDGPQPARWTEEFTSEAGFMATRWYDPLAPLRHAVNVAERMVTHAEGRLQIALERVTKRLTMMVEDVRRESARLDVPWVYPDGQPCTETHIEQTTRLLSDLLYAVPQAMAADLPRYGAQLDEAKARLVAARAALAAATQDTTATTAA